MQGGVAQGIGWALNEEYIYHRDGKVDNPGFLDYRMPVCSDLSMLDTVMVAKQKMAELMKTSQAQVDRLLDPNNGSATIESLQRAAKIVGRELRLQLV